MGKKQARKVQRGKKRAKLVMNGPRSNGPKRSIFSNLAKRDKHKETKGGAKSN